MQVDDKADLCLCFSYETKSVFLWRTKRGTCIKGLIWPPPEPKTENCFSSISSYWFIRRMVQVLNSGIYLNLKLHTL